MALTVRFTERALSDLTGIRDWLIERNPQAADRVRLQIAAAIDLLSSFPMIGGLTDEPGVRLIQLTRYPYRIFYTAENDSVVILHIRRVAQQSPSPKDLKP